MAHQESSRGSGRLAAARITPAMEDYLKAIHRIGTSGETVSNQRLAEELGFSGASISNMVKKLHELNLIVHTPYRSIALTDTGTAVALEVIRHHRLLELFLADALGMELDQVHAEADILEHHVSDALERRIEQALNFPEFDPHGHPIPSRTGDLPTIGDVPLTDLEVGDNGKVSSINDRSPEHLRDINSWKVSPGVNIEVTNQDDHEITASINTEVPVIIPRSVAEGIRVVLAHDPGDETESNSQRE
jgi:DtxR family Mn-dependent transcriptional regulator